MSAQKMYVNQYAKYKTTQILDVSYIDSLSVALGATHLSDTLRIHLSDGTVYPVRAHSSYTDSITFSEPRELLLREIAYYDKNAYDKARNPYGRPVYTDYYRSISGWGQRGQWNLANVHDPTVMRASDGYYYMYQTDASFGNAHDGHGHFHGRRSRDLVNWEYLGATLMDDCPAWALDTINALYARLGRAPLSSLTNMGYWAPVARKISDNLYRMYYCLVPDEWAVIGLMETTDPASNVWEDKGFVICSSSDKTASSFGTGSKWGGWFRFNAIDPTYVVTPEDTHWLIYGSWHSGIVAIQIDPATGKTKASLPDPWQTGTGANTTYGRRIATRDASSRWQGSEGPEVVYNPATGYYYLFLAYDELAVAYNTRVARSRNITGPYMGMNGTNITTGGECFPVVTHPYKFSSARDIDGWVGISHCAVFDDGQGNWFYSSQGRLPEGYSGDTYANAIMMGHVRRILWTPSGWPVVLPERYGAVPQASVTADELVGTWEHINLTYSYQQQQTSTTLVLHADGTMEGALSGKWSFDPDANILHLGNNSVCVARELDWEASPRHATLVYAGYNLTGTRTFWGKRVSD
ncbi:MAG: arabinan endo-1,5-alpha-L-arabinosidase [Bacteroidaceae bacterium]|nr:arabinan endo-1,5-alpha-L-arabinosidase [Bacteroidaceae bacterium]